MDTCSNQDKGISLIEILVVFAITSIALAYTFPALIDQSIRAKVNESISLAEPAKEALEKTCAKNAQATVSNNLEADYFYVPSGTEQDYVNKILLGADCSKKSMVIVIWTGNTGAPTDPIIEMHANGPDAAEPWSCRLIRGDERHVPSQCTQSYRTTVI